MKFMFTDGRTPNGVCAIKMFPEHFDSRLESRWAERLPDARYVYLTRRDVLGQAISLSVARQTNSYGDWMPKDREPAYDAGHIRRCLANIIEGEARWRLFFALNGIMPLEMIYEDLVEEPQREIDRIAHFVGVENAIIDWSAFHPNVQRNAVNEELRRRFIADSADLKLLPVLTHSGYYDTHWTDTHEPDPSDGANSQAELPVAGFHLQASSA